MKHTDNLPNVPSELLELAMRDLEAIEHSPFYTVDMRSFHLGASLFPLRPCTVCLAGTILVKELGKSMWANSHLSELPLSIQKKLFAIDYFRMGEIYNGLSVMDIEPPKKFSKNCGDFEVCEYAHDKARFKKDMHALITYLKTFNL